MRYQKLGKTDLKASVISFGTWGVGGGSVWQDSSVDTAELESLLDAAADLGINYIDTAPVYGTGTSETLLGKALKNGRRDKFLVQTKCSLNWRGEGGNKHYERDGYTVMNDARAKAGPVHADIAVENNSAKLSLMAKQCRTLKIYTNHASK